MGFNSAFKGLIPHTTGHRLLLVFSLPWSLLRLHIPLLSGVSSFTPHITVYLTFRVFRHARSPLHFTLYFHSKTSVTSLLTSFVTAASGFLSSKVTPTNYIHLHCRTSLASVLTCLFIAYFLCSLHHSHHYTIHVLTL